MLSARVVLGPSANAVATETGAAGTDAYCSLYRDAHADGYAYWLLASWARRARRCRLAFAEHAFRLSSIGILYSPSTLPQAQCMCINLVHVRGLDADTLIAVLSRHIVLLSRELWLLRVDP